MVLMFIITQREPDGIILIGDRRISCWIICRLAAWQAGNLRFEMRIAEEWHGIPRPFDDINQSIRGREKSVVGPPFQDIPAIDDVGILDDRRIDPFPVWQPD